jgi:type II restriction enzyme
LNYCLSSTPQSFKLESFINSFWQEPGLKRSIDKVYEIVVYALFSTLVEALELKVEVSIAQDKKELLEEFADFAQMVMSLDASHLSSTQNARVFRVGITNAADRGLDMYSNWGPALPIKHLSLDEERAESIVTSVSSDRIVIVCKKAEEKLILSLLNQIGWRSKIQSIVTEDNLKQWYEKALCGEFADILAKKLISSLCNEIVNEFPAVDAVPNILKKRRYNEISNDLWR